MTEGQEAGADRCRLVATLRSLEGRPYPAYKALRGHYRFEDFELWVDHVQGDPFATPSRLRVRVDLARAGFPAVCWATAAHRVGVCSLLARTFDAEARRRSRPVGSGKGGRIALDAPGQEVLETTAVLKGEAFLEARFNVGLPARGRRILGHTAAEILGEVVPALVRSTLWYRALSPEEVQLAADTNHDARALRAQLDDLGLAAFVADGAVLPRASGVDPGPLATSVGAVAFRSPDSLRVEVELPHAGIVTGMGIPRGVTLIVGGGFHGKSTLLRALQAGIYDHRPGDGRERVVSDATAVKIRAEDGRSVAGVDISPFISDLPGGVTTAEFSTGDASGSTSQAAAIVEALEAGARVLLLDEDTSATNFMLRDRRMQELVARDREPITPFLDRVRDLWERQGVSTILVMGGSGDYFDVADTVVAMEEFLPRDVTGRARQIATELPSRRRGEAGPAWRPGPPRCPLGESLDPSRGRSPVSVRSRGVRTLEFGREEIDLTWVEQLVHPAQLRTLGHALLLVRRLADGRRSVAQLLDAVQSTVEERGLDGLTERPYGDLAEVRRTELAAALNRLRSLRLRPQEGKPR